MPSRAGAQGLVLVLVLVLVCRVQAEDESMSPQGTDCTHIRTLLPEASSGVYVIQPPGAENPFKVYCEMRPDGGWTVFQRRSGAAVSFRRNWDAYKNGFGNLTHDHWLGLSSVFSLTHNATQSWTLRVDLWDHECGAAFAEYKNFNLGDEAAVFQLNVGNFTGDAGDAIRGAYPGVDQNGAGFSTSDRDNDGCSPCIFGDIGVNRCTDSQGGGWWYSRCGSAGLHGDWHPAGEHVGWASGLHWRTWKGPAPYSAKASRMMLRSE